ncbi:unnamed protein product [Cuscuta campestris]|uniref:Uncharacterized protein n=1 Tax=Cuscuta campestris TaxID=132261 RepID=A0A484M7G6_9ASTE|nr:unnamed protein product [Cuscuta campestris]
MGGFGGRNGCTSVAILCWFMMIFLLSGPGMMVNGEANDDGISKMSPFENRELMYKKYEREGVVSQEWVDNVVEFVEVGESTEDQEDGGGDDHDSKDCVSDGQSGGARDGKDRDHEDEEGRYHEGFGHQGQFVYVNSDDEVTITSAGAGLITPAFYERTDTTGMSWGKKNARVDPSIDEGRLRKAFLMKAAERYANFTYNQRNPSRLKKKKMDPRPFEQLKKVWEEDPEFLELSKIKKKNRRKGKEDGPALGTYCGGSVPFSENMNRLTKKKGGPVSLDEVIIHIKTKKHDDKTWVDPEHAELQAQFFELREEARQNGLQVTDEEIWYSLVEGHNAKNRVPGVGDYEREMRKMNPSSKPRLPARVVEAQRRYQHSKSKTKGCRNKLIV